MFYGWRMVALAFATNFISVGFGFYSYGVFFKAMAAEFGGSRFAVSSGFVSLSVMAALAAPFVGRLLDRGHTRALMTTGALLLALGFTLASRISALWHFYAIFGLLMGTGVCMLGGLAGSTLVANWFVARRGAALGFAAMGISVSGVVMPLVGTALLEAFGWRATFLVYAAIAGLLVAPAVFLWVVHRPEDIGQGPDGNLRLARARADGAPDGNAAHSVVVIGTRAILRDRNFQVIAGVLALNLSALGAVLTHAVPHATDLGYSPAAAALALSVMAGAGALGKPAFGALTDRMDKRTALWVAIALQLVGVELLLHAHAYPALLCAGAIFGVGMGGVVPLQGALVGAAFGRHAFGRVMGLLSPAMMPLTVLGSPFAGWVHDVTGHYELAFRVFVAMFAASMLLALRLRLPAVEPGLEAHDEPPPARAA